MQSSPEVGWGAPWHPTLHGYAGLARFASAGALIGTDLDQRDQAVLLEREGPRAVVEALYDEIARRRWAYAMPAWHAGAGQLVLPPEAIDRGAATCLDVAVLFAAMAKSAGLRPYLVIIATPGIDVSDHAVVVVDASRRADDPSSGTWWPWGAPRWQGPGWAGTWGGQALPEQWIALDLTVALRRGGSPPGRVDEARRTARTVLAQADIRCDVIDVVALHATGHEELGAPPRLGGPWLRRVVPDLAHVVPDERQAETADEILRHRGVVVLQGPSGSGTSTVAALAALGTEGGSSWVLSATDVPALRLSLARASTATLGPGSSGSLDLVATMVDVGHDLLATTPSWTVVVDDAAYLPELLDELPDPDEGQLLIIATHQPQWCELAKERGWPVVAMPPLPRVAEPWVADTSTAAWLESLPPMARDAVVTLSWAPPGGITRETLTAVGADDIDVARAQSSTGARIRQTHDGMRLARRVRATVRELSRGQGSARGALLTLLSSPATRLRMRDELPLAELEVCLMHLDVSAERDEPDAAVLALVTLAEAFEQRSSWDLASSVWARARELISSSTAREATHLRAVTALGQARVALHERHGLEDHLKTVETAWDSVGLDATDLADLTAVRARLRLALAPRLPDEPRLQMLRAALADLAEDVAGVDDTSLPARSREDVLRARADVLLALTSLTSDDTEAVTLASAAVDALEHVRWSVEDRLRSVDREEVASARAALAAALLVWARPDGGRTVDERLDLAWRALREADTSLRVRRRLRGRRLTTDALLESLVVSTRARSLAVLLAEELAGAPPTLTSTALISALQDDAAVARRYRGPMDGDAAGPLFRRRGVVRATRLTEPRTWSTSSGDTLQAEVGDWWLESPEGAGRSATDTAFTASHEHVEGDVWRRSGTVRAVQVDVDTPVATLEGNAVAHPGDWVVTGVRGERWPVADDVFRASYEPVRTAR